MLVGQGDLKLARDELTEVVAAARVAERPELRCEALLTLANVDWKQGLAGEERARLSEAAAIGGRDWRPAPRDPDELRACECARLV